MRFGDDIGKRSVAQPKMICAGQPGAAPRLGRLFVGTVMPPNLE
jgi:hypothetical protein